jgi:hypothetical protein
MQQVLEKLTAKPVVMTFLGVMCRIMAAGENLAKRFYTFPAASSKTATTGFELRPFSYNLPKTKSTSFQLPNALRP